MARLTYKRRRGSRFPTPRPPKEITWGQFAQKAWSGVQQIRKLINVESHRLDVSFGAAVDNSGSTTHLSAIAIGDTSSTRTGSTVLCKELRVRIAFQKHASATNTVVRYMLVVDKQQVADTSPAVTAVLTTADVLSHLVSDNVGRFKILKDVTIDLDAAHVMRTYQYYLPLTDHHITYNGSASTDVNKNGVYQLVLSNEATNTPSVTSINRLEFYDN